MSSHHSVALAHAGPLRACMRGSLECLRFLCTGLMATFPDIAAFLAADSIGNVQQFGRTHAGLHDLVRRNAFATPMSETFFHPIDALILQGFVPARAFGHFWDDILAPAPPSIEALRRVWIAVRSAAAMHAMRPTALGVVCMLAQLAQTCTSLKHLSAMAAAHRAYLSMPLPCFAIPLMPALRTPPAYPHGGCRAKPPYPELVGTYCCLFPLIDQPNPPCSHCRLSLAPVTAVSMLHLLDCLCFAGHIQAISESVLSMAVAKLDDIY